MLMLSMVFVFITACIPQNNLSDARRIAGNYNTVSVVQSDLVA